MPDDLSSTLEEIRALATKRDEALAWVARASADDGELDVAAGAFEAAQDKLAARALRLLAAIEAALKLTVRWENFAASSEECAGELRAAISRELTKGESR